MSARGNLERHGNYRQRSMGRKVDVDELVGAAEIANRLGVSKPSIVHDWRYRHPDFPKPIAHLKTALIWAWPDVEAWAKRTGRLPEE